MGRRIDLEIQTFLGDRDTIAVASGMLMELDQSTSKRASARLRNLARTFHITLCEMATVVIDSRN